MCIYLYVHVGSHRVGCGSMRVLTKVNNSYFGSEVLMPQPTSSLSVCYWTKGSSKIYVNVGNTNTPEIGEGELHVLLFSTSVLTRYEVDICVGIKFQTVLGGFLQ